MSHKAKLVRQNHWTVLGESILDFNDKGCDGDITIEDCDRFYEQLLEQYEANGFDEDKKYVVFYEGNEDDLFIMWGKDISEAEIRTNGADFVRFDDGYLGFVGYGNWNPYLHCLQTSWIKIVREATEEDEETL